MISATGSLLTDFKDTFSTQVQLLQTKAITKELSLTPGNGTVAKVELTAGSGIIPFGASTRCSVLLADSPQSVLVAPAVRSTVRKPAISI